MPTICLAYPGLFLETPEPSPEVAALLSEVPPLARFAGDTREAIYRDYLGPHVDDPPVYGVPGLADLTGLPPVAIAIAEYDDLRPSGEKLAQHFVSGVLRWTRGSRGGPCQGRNNNVTIYGHSDVRRGR